MLNGYIEDGPTTSHIPKKDKKGAALSADPEVTFIRADCHSEGGKHKHITHLTEDPRKVKENHLYTVLTS